MIPYTTDDIEILIATMDREDLSFLERIFSRPVDQIKYNVLIVNQSKTSTLKSIHQNLQVVNDVNRGLSRSRNLAMENATGKLLWILDDDCVVENDAVEKIIKAHNLYSDAILTFKTRTPDGSDLRSYKSHSYSLDKKSIVPILSPEISLKREAIEKVDLQYNMRFGLGAQFQDSENHVFLYDALEKKLRLRFVPETIVAHAAITSSDDIASNRIAYARGALMAKLHPFMAAFYPYKYGFFLWRKGYVKDLKTIIKKMFIARHGVEDFNIGFESHRNHHLDL